MTREVRQLVASVVITTWNRKDALRNAIGSALKQRGETEILVMDDASTDGSAAMVREEFPTVRIYRDEVRQGLIVQRNRAARLARADLIFSLDDDAVFTSPDTILEVSALLSDPRIGAVRLPLKNFVGDLIVSADVSLPEDSAIYVSATFPGGAHALKRKLFNDLGGYFEPLFHWGEETSYCQKLYAAGHAVAVYRGHPIHHYPHPAGRHSRAKNVWIYRNGILLPTINAPGAFLLSEWMIAVGTFLRNALLSPSMFPVVLEGILRGIGASLVQLRHRRPISAPAYRLFRDLKRRKAVALREIDGTLTALAGPARKTGTYAN